MTQDVITLTPQIPDARTMLAGPKYVWTVLPMAPLFICWHPMSVPW